MFQFFGTWQLLLCIVLLGFVKPIDAQTTDQGVDYPDNPDYSEYGSGIIDPCEPTPDDVNPNDDDYDQKFSEFREKLNKKEKCDQHQE